MSDFDCCALSDREVIALDMAARAEARAARFARWIAPTLLDHYPNGPYAVHAWLPATGRETGTRNHTADSAVAVGGAVRATRAVPGMCTCRWTRAASREGKRDV